MANPSNPDQPQQAAGSENVPNLGAPAGSLALTPGLSANIFSAAPVTGPAWTVPAVVMVAATPTSGGILTGSSGPAVLVGQGVGNHMLSGGSDHNVLISGGGDNVMYAVGGATTWVHNASGPDGIDIWADFNPGIGDKITWDQELHIAQSGQGIIMDPALGIDATGLVLVFDDGCKVGIPTVQDHTALDPSWVLPLPSLASPPVPTPVNPQSATPLGPPAGPQATVEPAPQNGPEYIAPMLDNQGKPVDLATVEQADKSGSILTGPNAGGDAVLLGGPGNDYLVGNPAPVDKNVLSGGGGTNTLTGNVATFVHSPGGTDVVTDWKADDHIALDKSVTLNSAMTGQGIITDPQAGLTPGTGLILVFDDHDAAGHVVGHSEMALAHVTAQAADPSWFVTA